MKAITSADNPQYKLFVKLLSARKYRQREGSYLAEGLNGLDIPAEQVKAYLLPFRRQEEVFRRQLPEEKVILLADNLFDKLSADPASQGLMLWLPAKATVWSRDWQPEAGGLYLAVEAIQDPGNLGTMIRTAEAAGVRALFCSAGTVDLYHPKTIKAAAASLNRLPVIVETNLLELLAVMRQKGISGFAAAPLNAMPYTDADYSGGALFLIGNEGNGLSSPVLAAAKRVAIPMNGEVESLNAAISAAVLLFEAKRQGV